MNSRLRKAKMYAALRVGAALIPRLIDGDFMEVWQPKLGAKFVKWEKDYCLTKEDAISEAKSFKAYCRKIIRGEA